MPDELTYRVTATGDDTPPDAAAFAAGEPFTDVGDAVRRAGALMAELCAADALGFVWVGHNGVTISGSRHAAPGWRVLIRQPPPGWPDPLREQQEADWRAWVAHKEAVAETQRIAKAAAAVAREAAPVSSRDTSMDALR